MARVVFMGTPDFAAPSLRALLQAHEVVAVVTQPDRPAGRSRQVRMSPIKELARAEGLPVMQPKRLRGDADAIARLANFHADAFAVAAYGQILPQAVLDIPDKGVINVHASLLPRWRGASPIQAAIRAGDADSGATIMLLDAGLDTGPILSQRAIPITKDETGGSLHDKLADLGAELLSETLPAWLNGEITPQKQNSALSTYAPQLKKADGEIDWTMPAVEIARLVRAYNPWPLAYTLWRDQRLTIVDGCAVEGQIAPGLVRRTNTCLSIGAGDGCFMPTIAQLPGKKRLPITDFINGYPDFAKARLGK